MATIAFDVERVRLAPKLHDVVRKRALKIIKSENDMDNVKKVHITNIHITHKNSSLFEVSYWLEYFEGYGQSKKEGVMTVNFADVVDDARGGM